MKLPRATPWLLGFLAVPFLVAAAEPPLDALTRTAAQSHDPKLQLNVLRGMNAALKGKRDIPAPKGWPEFYASLSAAQNAELKQQAQMLSVIFGGGEALADLRKALGDPKAPLPARKAALESLVSAHDQPAVPLLLALVRDGGPLRGAAVRGLAGFDQLEIPKALLTSYSSLATDEKRDAIAALAMRPASARALLDAVDRGKLTRTDVSAPIARQLQDLKDPAIDQWLAKNWGAVRTSSAEKQKEIARFKTFLTPAAIEKGDPSHGRALFTQTCAVCHTLFGFGGKIGPELPGAFEDVDYLLQNIIDPNAIIGKDYQQTVIQTKAGQTLIGIVAADDPSSVTLKSLAGPVTVQRSDIAQLSVLEMSLMPEGLLLAMKETDVRDLFAYLRLHGPVPMLASPANANDFFNGTDFTNWSVSSAAKWRVESGTIIGRGSEDRAEFITSELLAENFRLRAELALSGPGSAEIVLRGSHAEGGFTGLTLRLSGTGQLALLRYEKAGAPPAVEPLKASGRPGPIEIAAHGEKLTVSMAGTPVAEIASTVLPPRTNFQFRVAGADTELRLKSLALSVE
jgi:putative heme-binding domain-containing protein